MASINGTISELDSAVIPLTDRGFLYGDGVFETLVAFHGQVLGLESHLQRAKNSMERLKMSFPWHFEEIKFEIQALLDAKPFSKSIIRIMFTRGSNLGLGIDTAVTPNKYIMLYQAPVEPKSLYAEGLALELRHGDHQVGTKHKTLSYLDAIIGLHEAKAKSFQDILWLNAKSEVTECLTSNIFFLAREGDTYRFETPALHSGILPGTTRSTLIQLMQNATIPIVETQIYKEELPKYDEAFCTSSVRGLVPVKRIGSFELKTTRKNAAYWHIERLYLSHIESQLGFRVAWNSGEKVERKLSQGESENDPLN